MALSSYLIDGHLKHFLCLLKRFGSISELEKARVLLIPFQIFRIIIKDTQLILFLKFFVIFINKLNLKKSR